MSTKMSLDISGSTRSSWSTYFRLLSYLKGSTPIFLFGLLTSALAGFLDGCLGQYFRSIAGSDVMQLQHQYGYWIWYAFLYFVLRAFVGFASVFCIFYVGNKLMSQLRYEAFSSLMGSRLQYVRNANTGGILSLLNYNVSQVEAAATSSIRRFVLDVSLIVTACISLFRISSVLTFFVLSIAPMIYFSFHIFAKKVRKESQRIQDTLGTLMRYAEQSIDAICTIRSLSAHAKVLSRFKQHLHYTLGHQLRYTFASSMLHALLQFVMSIPLVFSLFLIVGGHVKLSASDLVGYVYTLIRIMPPIRAMSLIVSDFQRGVAAAASIFSLCDHPQDSHEGEEPFTLAELTGHDISFEVQDRPILKGLSFSFAPAQLHVLVGVSGVGKSTLLLLLAQLLYPTRGELRVGKLSYADLDLSDFRRHVGFMDQLPMIWDDSIVNNIIFPNASEDIDRARYEEVLQLTALDAWIETLPDGDQTALGAGYVLPSGGQCQRISLARILYHAPDVMILDEPTASVDEQTSKRIWQAMLRLRQRRTIIIATHQKQCAQQADVVHYMTKDGLISGSHEQLMTVPAYRAFWDIVAHGESSIGAA